MCQPAQESPFMAESHATSLGKRDRVHADRPLNSASQENKLIESQDEHG